MSPCDLNQVLCVLQRPSFKPVRLHSRYSFLNRGQIFPLIDSADVWMKKRGTHMPFIWVTPQVTVRACPDCCAAVAVASVAGGMSPQSSSWTVFGRHASRGAGCRDCSAIYRVTVAPGLHRGLGCHSGEWHLKCKFCVLSFTNQCCHIGDRSAEDLPAIQDVWCECSLRDIPLVRMCSW